MNIVEWFDPQKREHLQAWWHLCISGAWPDGFIPAGCEFPPHWQFSVAARLAEQYVTTELRKRGHWQKGVPERDGLYWLAYHDGVLTGPGQVLRTNGELIMAGGLRVKNGVGGWAGWYWSEPIPEPPKPGPWDDGAT